jgi:O-antigen/teichoic acid export membrane protein
VIEHGGSSATDSGLDRSGSRIFRALGQQIVGKLSVAILAIVYVSISSRYLGPNRYGEVTAALAFAGIFTTFSDFGVNAVAIRDAGGDELALINNVRSSLGLSYVYAGPLAAVACAVGSLVYLGSKPQLFSLTLVTAPYIVSYTITSCYLPVFQHFADFRGQVYGDIVASLLTLVFALASSQAHLGPYPFVAVVAVGQGAKLTIAHRFASRWHALRPSFDLVQWRILARSALPIGLASLIGSVYFRADAVILSIVGTAHQTGLYALGYRLVSTALLLPTLITSSSFAVLAASASSREESRRHGHAFLSALILLAYPLGMFGPNLSSSLLRLLGGGSYTDATFALSMLFIATSVSFVTIGSSILLTLMRRQAYLLKISALTLAINIALNLGFDSRHGASSASLSLVATEFISLLLVLAPMRSYLFEGISIKLAVGLSGVLLLSAGVCWAHYPGGATAHGLLGLSVYVFGVAALGARGLLGSSAQIISQRLVSRRRLHP